MTDGRTSGRRLRLLLALLLAGLLAAVAGANLWKGDLRVAGVEVRGTRIVPQAEVIRLAAIPEGARLFAVDLFAVRRRIEENAFIRTADVAREIPGRILITVEERRPVAILGTEQLLYLDREGTILPPAASPYLVDLPVITGDLPRRELVAGRQTFNPDLREALEIVCTAPRVSRSLALLLSEVHLGRNGEFVLYTADGGVPVQFGRGEVIRKLVYFDAFWQDRVRNRGAAALGSVDLRFEDQIVVRWRTVGPSGRRPAAKGRPQHPGGDRSPT